MDFLRWIMGGGVEPKFSRQVLEDEAPWKSCMSARRYIPEFGTFPGAARLLFAAVALPANLLVGASVNDNFANATPISQYLYDYVAHLSGSTASATKESGEPNHAGQTGGHSVWWTWTAPSSGAVQLWTDKPWGSAVDTLLGAYTGSAVSNLTTIASDDDGFGDGLSALSFNAVAGTTYYFAVDDTGAASGEVTLKLSFTPDQVLGNAPANDAFSNAIPITLSGNSGQFSGSNVSASKESGEPNHAGNAGGHSVWWNWRAPSDGTMQVTTWTTFGFNIDTLLGVYTGLSVSTLTTIASDDDSGGYGTSALSFSAEGGRTYYFAVDGNGGEVGDVALVLSFAPSGRIIRLTGNLTFGSVLVGSSATTTLTISNTGDSPLSVTGITYPTGFSGNWSSGTIAAGASQNVTVTFTPTANQSFYGTITVQSDKTSGTDSNIISGAGIAPSTVIDPGAKALGEAGGDYTIAVTSNTSWTANSDQTWATVSPAGGSGNGTVSVGVTTNFATTPRAATIMIGGQTHTLTQAAAPAVPIIVSTSPARQVLRLGTSKALQVIYTSDSAVSIQWLHNGLPLSGSTSASHIIANASAIDAGYYQVRLDNEHGSTISRPIFVNLDYGNGELVGWGYSLSMPTTASGISVPLAVNDTFHALKTDGTVAKWTGGNWSSAGIPVGATEVVAIASRYNRTIALKSDGTVLTWGAAYAGDLAATGPVGLANVVAVAASAYSFLALKQDGTVTVWGAADYYPLPQPPESLNGVVAIEAGDNHALALKADGTVVGWGGDYGEGTPPVGLNGVVAIAAGNDHSAALRSDGSMVAWGWNAWGQTTVPPGLTNVLVLRGAYDSTMALKGDGTVVTWGNNLSTPGMLGLAVGINGGGGNHLFAIKAAVKMAQSILFSPLVDQPLNSGGMTLSASATSTLPVTFTVVSGPATIANNQLTFTGTGLVTIRASQDGDADHEAAVSVERAFTVLPALDYWRSQKFGVTELADAAISGPNADPDGDGLSNLVEYALGLEPKSPTTAGMPEVGVSNGDWTYTYTRPADRSDLNYTVEASTNLTTWSTNNVSHSMVTSSGGTETWRARYPVASAANIFFRLTVTTIE